MLSTIGLPGLILIIFVVLIFFGPRKLPELGRSFGTTLREFKDSTRGVFDETDKNNADK
ncbi:twin-arginine translocase TatA/TatE family subunit [Paenibacillus abyssi]|uniref:Sec-independent protein translocase protein TatAy n=1 Tax=Paenibacillus abyssi TaxID=1340531 RepID=A0A917LEJ4_9BACL|nr:twin-arginine translocase TatA/TatE family subunit [Paenibacillus abyssi]GGG16956.1 Sec-independent protein translocase protein TatAy [Paenibacillus abyssi]